MKSAEIERMEWWAQNKPTSGMKFGEYWIQFQNGSTILFATGKTLYEAIDNAIAGNVQILMDAA